MAAGSVLAGADEARIRLVSRRFRSLQGLTRMLFGAFLFFITVVPRADDGLWGTIVISGFVQLIWLTGGYYRRRFGRVGNGLPPNAEYVIITGLLVLVAVLSQRGTMPGLPSILFLAIALYSCWIVYRDHPFRPWFLIIAVAATASSVAAVGLAGEPGLTFWIRQSLRWMAGPLILTGWLDHRLLVRSIRPAESTDQRGECLTQGPLHADAI